MAPAMRKMLEWLGLTDSPEEFDPEYDRPYGVRNGSELREETYPKGPNVQVYQDNPERPPRQAPSQVYPKAPENAAHGGRNPFGTDSDVALKNETRSRQPVDLPDRGKMASGIPTIRPIINQVKPTVHIVYPKRFRDATEVADLMRDGLPVILNLQNVESDLPRRMIDFCSGVTYALQGKMERVADGVFLLSPSNVTVSQEERANLSERGVF